jgi:LPXTG-motif cell wall-anchored protein
VKKEQHVKRNKSFVFIFCLALLFAVAMPSAMMADEWDKATKLTFSEPVEVPGLVLAAGTYWFTLADSDSDRNIVQVWDADRTHLVTSILAIPDYRLQPTGKTVIHFEERPSDSPEAIHSWYYPGANYGEEFVYPKTRAAQFAKQTSRPVLSMPDEPPADTTQIKQAPVIAINPSGEEIEITEIVATQPLVVPVEAPASSLPKTGSSLPLLEAAGLLALAAAVVLRVAAQKMV